MLNRNRLWSLVSVLALVGGSQSTGTAAQMPGPNHVAPVPYAGTGITQRWSYLDGFTARIRSVVVDAAGDVIVAGDRAAGALIRKLDGDSGNTLWTATLSATSVRKMVVDEAGACYVAGNYYPGGFPDVSLTKINATGSLVWTYRYDELNNNDEGLDVALGSDDSVVVVGHANGLQGANFFTAKLSRAGNLLWTRQIDGGSSSVIDSATAVAMDPQGGVLVTGTSEGSGTFYAADVVTAKYAADGTLLWIQRFDGTAASHDRPWDIAATGDGGCVVVGSTEGLHSSADPLVLRYGPDGTLHWLYDRGTNNGDSARAVVLDAQENIYLTGSTFTSKGGFDILVVKLLPSGQRAWQVRWDGGEGRGDGGHAIDLDFRGRVLVAGHSYHWWTENDVTALVLDPDLGRVLDSAFFDGPLSRHDTPLAIAAGARVGFFVGGYANGAYPQESALVLRYDFH